jgi:hypothetical protein
MKEKVKNILRDQVSIKSTKSLNQLTDEIDTLYKVDFDKRVAFEVACNPDLLEAETNYRLYEGEINQLKEIINILSDFAQYGPFAFSEEEIMMRLEKVEQLKKGAGL